MTPTEYTTIKETLEELKLIVSENRAAIKLLDIKIAKLEVKLDEEIDEMERAMAPGNIGLSEL